MIAPPDFEARTVDVARRATDDIVECDRAEMRISWHHGVPLLEFVFTALPGLRGQPMLAVQLVAESRSKPLAPGRLLSGDEVRRHVRTAVEAYLKANGIDITRKVIGHASL